MVLFCSYINTMHKILNSPMFKKTLLLKKSNLNRDSLILILIIFSLFISPIAYGNENKELKILIEPSTLKQGETISIKIEKFEDKSKPKVFYDKTKYPVFDLSEKYFRVFVPLTANEKIGKHNLDIHYAGLVKNINVDIKQYPYPVESITLSKTVSALMASKIERELVNKALSSQNEKKYWSGKFIYPSDARQSTQYGVKRKFNGVLSPDYFHKGLDFAGQTGSPVKAPADGIISLAGYNSKGFVVNGNCLFIDHGHGVVSGYLHLNEISVKEGDFVKKGQNIGKVGSTGIATGPHLHWGIYVNGKPVEPLYWVNMSID